MDADGEVLRAARRGGGRRRRRGSCSRWAPRRVVIHFLHSYINPAHERRAAEIVRRAVAERLRDGRATRILSEYREYERGVTAAVNAAIQPVLDRYLARLQRELAARGFDARAAGDAGQRRHGVGAHRRRDGGEHRDVGPGLGRDRRGLHRRAPRASRTSSPTTWAAPRPTSALIQDGRPRVSTELELEYAHADPRADGRRAHDRRRRRLDRLGRRRRHAAGRAGERRRRARADLLRPRRRASRPSPTPTSSSAG